MRTDSSRVGGGSAIDTAKAVSAGHGPPARRGADDVLGLRVDAVLRHARRGTTREDAGESGANTVAVVYEPALTLDLPRGESVGTAMNALAHCAEALYAGPCEDASARGALIGTWLPARRRGWAAISRGRTRLLEGAMHAGMALAERGLFLAHAMAQALGGRYGASHGAMNALCLAAGAALQRAPSCRRRSRALATAMGVTDAAARVEELARLGGFERLRDHGIPEVELPGGRGGDRPAARRALEPATCDGGRHRGAPPLDLVTD